MNRRPSIFPAPIVFFLVSITAPYWLCLRGWWGREFTITLFLATGFHIVALLAASLMLSWIGAIHPDDSSWIMPSLALTAIGVAIQCIWAVTAILRKFLFSPLPPRTNFAGSFLLLPQRSWPLPLDAVLVGSFLLLYPGDPLPLPVLHDIPHIGTVTWPPMDAMGLYTAWLYCALSTLTFITGGYLLGTSYGRQPASRPTRIKRIVASLMTAAKPSRETLSHILSRRPKDLQAIASPQAKSDS